MVASRKMGSVMMNGRSEHRTSPEQEVVNGRRFWAGLVAHCARVLNGQCQATIRFAFVHSNQSQDSASDSRSLLHDPH